MARRTLDTFLVSRHYPYFRAPELPACPFFIRGTPDSLDLKKALAMAPDWRPQSLREGVWVKDEAFDASAVLKQLAELWPRLSRVCDPTAIGQLIDLADERRQSRYIDAGHNHEREEKIRLAEAVASEAAETDSGESPHDLSGMRVSKDRSRDWFFRGYFQAFLDELDEAESRLRQTESLVRLQRAWQWFVESSRQEEPHRLVSLVTALEALLGSSTSELRYQLATRVAWMLVPSKPSTEVAKRALFEEWGEAMASTDPARQSLAMETAEQLRDAANDSDIEHLLDQFPHALEKQLPKFRMQEYEDISAAYNLRSKIVHGGNFDWKKIKQHSVEMRETIRQLFKHILRDESAFEVFMNPDEKALHRFLKELPLKG